MLDAILNEQELSIEKLAANQERLDTAEVNLNSCMAGEIRSLIQKHPITVCRDLAKGSENYGICLKEFLEAKRLVMAGKEKLKFLQNKYDWYKLKEKMDFYMANGSSV